MKTINSFVALLIMLIFMSCSDNLVSEKERDVESYSIADSFTKVDSYKNQGKLIFKDSLSDNVYRRYATTITINPSESVTIDGSVVGFFGWSFLELHSSDEVELLFNFETVALQLTDFMVNGIRVENMSLINHGASPITINLIITGVR